MCGRFCLDADSAAIGRHFAVNSSIILKPRYNISPNEDVIIIRKPGCLEFMHWGLRPKWLKADQKAFINARMETISEKPAFRHAFKQRRCLIIASGYYEWKAINNQKQPYFISLPNRALFAFAGVWEDDGCAIITKIALKPELSVIHQRMPVIISATAYDRWLDSTTKSAELHACMLKDLPGDLLIFPVSPKVNSPKFDVMECVLPLH